MDQRVERDWIGSSFDRHKGHLRVPFFVTSRHYCGTIWHYSGIKCLRIVAISLGFSRFCLGSSMVEQLTLNLKAESDLMYY